jgi:hypothetical protein
LERRDRGEAGGRDVAMEADRATVTYNPAAHAIAASNPDEPKCYEHYWMIKGVI